LALGAGQLEIRFFDLSVLERYRLAPPTRSQSTVVLAILDKFPRAQQS
jgi:hypothetical protein